MYVDVYPTSILEKPPKIRTEKRREKCQQLKSPLHRSRGHHYGSNSPTSQMRIPWASTRLCDWYRQFAWFSRLAFSSRTSRIRRMRSSVRLRRVSLLWVSSASLYSIFINPLTLIYILSLFCFFSPNPARRYLRFFKFVDAFEAGYSAWQAPAPLESDAVKKLAAIGKWSFLGVYLLLEDFTIVR